MLFWYLSAICVIPQVRTQSRSTLRFVLPDGSFEVSVSPQIGPELHVDRNSEYDALAAFLRKQNRGYVAVAVVDTCVGGRMNFWSVFSCRFICSVLVIGGLEVQVYVL